MNIIKKIVLIFIVILMIIYGILPSFSYADSLNDAQRQAIVDTAVKIVDEGNKARILRYSQGHRNTGYQWRKLPAGETILQTTSGYVNLTAGDLAVVTAIMNKDLGRKRVDWIPAVVTQYACILTGNDIQDTIAFDCSSFCSAVYNMVVGAELTNDGGGWYNAWTCDEFNYRKEFFSIAPISDAEPKPGDTLWKETHVALYLGDCYGDGQKYIAEAARYCGNFRNK